MGLFICSSEGLLPPRPGRLCHSSRLHPWARSLQADTVPSRPYFYRAVPLKTPQHVLVSARSGPSRPHPISPMPQFQYGLIFTIFDNDVLKFVGHPISRFWDPLETDSPSDFIDTYPAGLWDAQRSLIMFPIWHSKPEQISAIMVRLQVQRISGCVMLFAIRIRRAGEDLWFCRLYPASGWGGNESERQVVMQFPIYIYTYILYFSRYIYI